MSINTTSYVSFDAGKYDNFRPSYENFSASIFYPDKM